MSQFENSPVDSDSVAELPVTSVLESIPDAVVIADADTGRIVTVNDAAGELFDCEPGTLRGLHRLDLHPPDDADAYEKAFERGRQSETIGRLHDGSPLYVESRTGERKPVEINAQRLDDGDRTLVLGVFRDLSDRLQREKQHKQTAQRLDTLLDAAPLPVTVLDDSGIVKLWNRAAEETFGYAFEEVIDTPYPLFVDGMEFGELLDEMLDDGILEGYETVHRAKDGSLVDVEIYARPLYDGDTITGVVGAAIDITDRKHRAQRLDVLHRLLRHNLRNRLTVIRGVADHLASDPELDPDETSEAAEKIVTAAEDLSSLSDQARQTRALVKSAQSDTESIRLTDLLERLRTVPSDVPDATVDISTSVEGVTVPRQAKQSLSWLLSHAVEYMETPAVEIDVESGDRHVRLDVRGETPLVSNGDRKLITSGEETALEHGKGLAVPRAYLTLSANGGGVSTLPASPQGSAIRIELPRTDIESEPVNQ